MRKVSLLLLLVGIIFLSACTSKEFTTNFESGKKAIKDHNFETALTDLTKANELNPKDQVTKNLLAITQNIVDSKTAMDKGELEASLFLIDKAANHKQTTVNKSAITYAKQQKQDLESLLKQSANLEAAISTAKSLIEQENFDEALAALQKGDMTKSTFESITTLQSDVKLLQVEAEKDKEMALAKQKLEEEKKAVEKQKEQAAKVNKAQTPEDAIKLVESLAPGNYTGKHFPENDLTTEDTSFYFYISYSAATGIGGDVFVQKGTGKIYGVTNGTETDPNAPFPDFSVEIR